MPSVATSLKDAENAFRRDDFDAIIINAGEINGIALLWMAPKVVLPSLGQKEPQASATFPLLPASIIRPIEPYQLYISLPEALPGPSPSG